MQQTTKLHLKKPEPGDYVNISDLNDNMDILEGTIGPIQSTVQTLQLELNDLETQLGNLTDLETDEKENLVSAINELRKSIAELRKFIAAHQTDDAKRIKVKQGIIIATNGWLLNQSTQLYEYKINDSDIFANTIVDLNIKITDLEKASDLKSANESFDGYVQLYAEVKPTENITCDLKMIRQVF